MSREEQAAILSEQYHLVGEADHEHRVAYSYSLARDCIRIFESSYGFRRRPEIFIVEVPGLGAFATKTDVGYAIIIPTGVYDFAEAEYKKYFGDQDTIEILENPVAQNTLADLFFLFVIFHEYVHIANGHVDYLISKNFKIDDSEYRALEYDADSFAVIMVYRSLQYLFPEALEEDLLFLVYAAIYWPLRIKEHSTSLMGKSPSRHPSWGARLSICASKLAGINNITDKGFPRDLEIARRRIEVQLDVFIEQEKRYSLINGFEDSRKFLLDLYELSNPVHSEIKECARIWWEIKDRLLPEAEEGVGVDGEGLDWKFEEGRFSFNRIR